MLLKMKTLIIYYSLTGHTELVAEALAKELNADILKIRPIKEIDNTKLTRYFWGGSQVFMNQKPELEPFDLELDQYDFIIIGTPVWAFTYSAPINSLFTQVEIKDKKVAVFCTSEGGNRKTLENMEKRLEGNNIVGKKNFMFNTEEQVKEIPMEARNWCKALTEK